MFVNWIRRFFASLMFIGYLPGPTGTYGSAVTVLLLWLGRTYVTGVQLPSFFIHYWLLCLAVIAISIWLSNDSLNVFGKSDAGNIIIDEVAGQLITFFLIPINLRVLVLGFFLFRFFDIVKPFHIHTFEELDDGLGVTMDDVIAGIYANISLMLILWIYHGLRIFIYS